MDSKECQKSAGLLIDRELSLCIYQQGRKCESPIRTRKKLWIYRVCETPGIPLFAVELLTAWLLLTRPDWRGNLLTVWIPLILRVGFPACAVCTTGSSLQMLLEDVFWPVTFPQRRTGCWGGSAAEPKPELPSLGEDRAGDMHLCTGYQHCATGNSITSRRGVSTWGNCDWNPQTWETEPAAFLNCFLFALWILSR